MRKFSYLLLAMFFIFMFVSMAFSADEPAKWQPQYGEKGELLNPEPSISFYRTISSDGNSDFPVIATDSVLAEDFESAWTSADGPGDWQIIDNGTEGTQNWWTDDPTKFYYTSWSDTVCRVLYFSNSTESNYDEWVISPTIDFSSAAACTLFWREYYYRVNSSDTARVLGSIDNGATWTQTIRQYTATVSSKYDTVDISGWAAHQSQVKIAFRQKATSAATSGNWYIDKVSVDADNAQLWLEDFNNWGPYGNNPPSGWTILDNGTPKAAEGPWNVNDWYKYTGWSSGTARVTYTTTYREWQDEWLISPAFNLNSGSLCSLKVVEYYSPTTSAPDHGYILLSTDGGTTWPDTVADHTTSMGSSSTKTAFRYDISSHAGESGLKIAFYFVNDPYGYATWQIDDFKIEETVLVGDDVTKTAINAPTMAIEGYDWNIQTTVFNLGTNAATFDDSTYIERIQKTSYLFENFNGDWGPNGDNPPSGWTILDYGDEAIPTWNGNDWNRYSYWSGYVARVNYTPVEHSDEWLITPAVDLTGVTQNIYMTFHSYFNWYASDTAYIFGSNDNGTTWIDTLAFWTTDHMNENPVFDITSWAANQSQVKIAFKYLGQDDMVWYVDDVEVYSLAYPAAEYVEGENIVGLASLDDTLITYSTLWSPSGVDNYSITSFVTMSGDADNSNDTTEALITCYPHFPTGGPDASYYSWDDNITGTGTAFNWYDISSRAQVTWNGTGDDRSTSGIDLGFSFYFYGTNYTRIFISENGFVSFDTISTVEYTNYSIPSTSGQGNILALLWDDLKADVGTAYYAAVDYDSDSDVEFIIQYDSWKYVSTSITSTIQMQMILDPTDNSIIYQYNQHGPQYGSYTVGIENATEDIGLLYYYYSSSTTNTNHPGNSALPGLAITYTYDPPQIDGALTSIDIPADGSAYLVGESFTPTVTISALGNDSFTAQVTLRIYDDTQALVYDETETSATVPGQGSIQHAFATDYDVDTEGAFDVEAFVVVTLDANNANDSLTGDFDANLHYSEGGPDAYGYRFIDNISFDTGLDLPPAPTFSYVDIHTTGDTLRSGDDNYRGPITLGFDFNFYGTNYSQFYLSTNGFITFDAISSSYYSNYCLPYSSLPYKAIYAFWDDLNVRYALDGGAIYGQYFDADVDYYVIQFYNASRLSYYGDPMDFEIILYADGNILMQYLDTNDLTYGHGQSATVGIENNTLTSGLDYECNGDPAGNLLNDSLAILFYYYQPAIDPVMVSIDAPLVGEVGTETFPAVTVKNNGTSATTMDVTVKIVDPSLTPPADTVYSQTETTVSIDALTTQQHVFATGWTPASSGSHTVLASVYVLDDEFDNNNDAQTGITVYDTIEDFETGNANLIASGDWEYGTPTGGYPASAHSGTNCWGTKLNGSALTTNTISNLDFEVEITSADPSLTFWEWYDGSSSYYFRILIDDGSGYTQIAQWTGINEYWQTYTIDLSAYIGVVDVRLQVQTGTYTYDYYEGWYVDDFGFVDCELYFPDYDVEVVSIDAPTGYLSGGETYDVVATIKNNGLNTVTFDVDAFDNHGFTNTQSVTDLEFLQTTQVLLPGWTVTACSSYTLTVATDLLDDEVADNDTLAADYLTIPTYNKVGQYDDNIAVTFTRLTLPEAVIANQFEVPYQGTELSAIGFVFTQDGENDTVNVYLFLDDNDDGLPDTIPAYTERIVRAGYGETMWLIGCGVTPVIIDCESFWAGWSLIDTVVAQNLTTMAIDNTNNFGMGWIRWRDNISLPWGWFPWNSTSDGDNMIRAYYDIDEATAPIASVTPDAVEGATDPGTIYTGTSTLENTVAIGCDLDYTVSLRQFVSGLVTGNQDRGEPIAWAKANDKTDLLEVIADKAENTVPVYPPMTLATGGPDASGYTWKDSNEPEGPTYGWLDISTIGTEIGWPSATDSLDDQIVTIPMGMTFNFYDVDYTNIVVSTNGWASFLAQTNSYYTDAAIPSSANPNALLAVYWDDLEGQYPAGTYGKVFHYYDATENRFIVSWTNWHHLTNSENINFQLILDADDNTVRYQYASVHSSQTDYAVGIENANGTVGLQVARNQAYLAANKAVQFLPPPTWLSTDLVDGSLIAGGSLPFDIYMDATDLDCGFYHGAVIINSNDPINPVATVDVQFTVGSNLGGTVTDASEAPLEGVLVEIMDGVTLVASDNTDINGIYDITCFAGGTYMVNFFKTGYYDAQAEVTIAIGDTETQDMVLNAVSSYSGLVTDFYTTPLPDVHVWVEAAPMLAVSKNLSKGKAVSVPVLTKISGNVKKDFSNIGEPVRADNIDQIQPVEFDPPMIDAEYCDIVLGGAYLGGYDGAVWGLESWAVFQDPATCALTETYPYQVYSLMFSLQNTSGVDQQLDFTVAIHEANMENPSCPTIGDAVYVSDPYSFVLLNGYVWSLGDFPVNAIVNGPYFMVVNITSDHSAAPMGWPVGANAATPCVAYNNSGTGWDDLSAYFAYNPVDWWHSQGFNTSADNIVTDTWTDVNGEYALALEPGDYVVHFDTTGWNSHITDPFTIETGETITPGTVVMRRPGSLSGTVEDEAGPLANVHVTVDNGLRTIIGQDYTDAFGYYSISNIYDGDYTITFTLSTYETIVLTGQHINDGQAVVIDQVMVSDVVTIYDIQFNNTIVGSTDPDTCYPSPYFNDDVIVTGTVVAIQQDTSTTTPHPYYYIQDCATADWNGVYVYDDTQVGMQLGDNVTLKADVDEYYGLTELKNVTEFVINSTGSPLCTLVVTNSDLLWECDPVAADGENLEGMLVKIVDAYLSSTASGGRAWIRTAGATDSVEVDDDLYVKGLDKPEPWEVGATYPYIMGMVQYSYGNYEFWPRFASDVAPLGFAYVPGDVNMSEGGWPPSPLSNDVTYLVNAFRGLPSSTACDFDGFWASADPNGDCAMLSNDVTFLVNFFRGLNTLDFCDDYPPLWLTPGDAPATKPDGWPFCDPPIVTGKVIPTSSPK